MCRRRRDTFCLRAIRARSLANPISPLLVVYSSRTTLRALNPRDGCIDSPLDHFVDLPPRSFRLGVARFHGHSGLVDIFGTETTTLFRPHVKKGKRTDASSTMALTPTQMANISIREARHQGSFLIHQIRRTELATGKRLSSVRKDLRTRLEKQKEGIMHTKQVAESYIEAKQNTPEAMLQAGAWYKNNNKSAPNREGTYRGEVVKGHNRNGPVKYWKWKNERWVLHSAHKRGRSRSSRSRSSRTSNDYDDCCHDYYCPRCSHTHGCMVIAQHVQDSTMQPSDSDNKKTAKKKMFYWLSQDNQDNAKPSARRLKTFSESGTDLLPLDRVAEATMTELLAMSSSGYK